MTSLKSAKAGFYYYFDSKDDVLNILIEEHVHGIIAEIKPVVDHNRLNALEKLKSVFYKEFQLSLQDAGKEDHVHNINNVDMHQRILVMHTRQVAYLIASIIEQGIQENIFQVDYPVEMTQILLFGFHFISDLGIFDWDETVYLGILY